MDVEAGGSGLGEETEAIEREVGVRGVRKVRIGCDLLDAGFFVTEVEVDGLDLGGTFTFTCGEVFLQLEVGAEAIECGNPA